MRIRYRAVATMIATALVTMILTALVTSHTDTDTDATDTFVCDAYMQAWPDGTTGCTLLDGYRVVPAGY